MNVEPCSGVGQVGPYEMVDKGTTWFAHEQLSRTRVVETDFLAIPVGPTLAMPSSGTV